MCVENSGPELSYFYHIPHDPPKMFKTLIMHSDRPAWLVHGIRV